MTDVFTATMVGRAGSGYARGANPTPRRDVRLIVLVIAFAVVWGVIAVRLFTIQILQRQWYQGLAVGQRELFARLYPERGEILAHDRRQPSGWFPLATNEERFTIAAAPKDIADPAHVAGVLAPVLSLDEDAERSLAARLAKPGDPYEPILRNVPASVRDAALALRLPGVFAEASLRRFYPDGSRAAQLTGFVGEDERGVSGRYGIEGAFDDVLAGTVGYLEAERDPRGRWIIFGKREVSRARNGADLHLTIDRAIQSEACARLDAAVRQHGAAGGSVVVVHPITGAIRAMCGTPSFDPNAYAATEDLGRFRAPAVVLAYEPGSVFKPITMAAAIDAEVVTPATMFEDTGRVSISGFTITNTSGRVYGRATMADVLRFSINTGAVFAARTLGIDRFRAAVERFGFGARTGIELDGESPGDTSNLSRREEVYLATASYGQGVSVTPLQLAMAYAAIANGGTLMRPYLVEEIVEPDGTQRRIEPHVIHRVVSARTATLVQGMLVSVVREGYPKRAGVAGYLIGGKTGTAQIPLGNSPGYSVDTIHTFAGLGPIDAPTFAMVVRIDRPQRAFADSTAAPLFGEIAKFILEYDGIAPKK